MARFGPLRRAPGRAPGRVPGRPPRGDLRPLFAFASAVTRSDRRATDRAIARAKRQGWPRRALEELAIMLMLHAGYPAALEGSAALSRQWPARVRRTREGGVSDWRRRGERRCAQVYGPNYRKLVANVRALHPDLAVMMIEQGYGRVLSRPGLSARARELTSVTVLAAGGWERQLISHLIGARRMAARPADLRAALRAGLAGTGPRTRAAAARAWAMAFPSTRPRKPLRVR